MIDLHVLYKGNRTTAHKPRAVELVCQFHRGLHLVKIELLHWIRQVRIAAKCAE